MSSVQKQCIFCTISNKECPDTTILYETDTVCVFKDIRPASEFHYLAIPKRHVNNAKSLSIDDIPLSKCINNFYFYKIRLINY